MTPKKIMHSIQSKTILLNVIAISVSILVITMIGAITIANFGHNASEQSLALLCESGKHNLDQYFKSVEQSGNIISSMVSNSLKDIAVDVSTTYDDAFITHIDYIDGLFKEIAEDTAGVLTYYYRIDPDISDLYEGADEATAKKALGFYYEKTNGQTFEWYEPTDLKDESLNRYWFVEPKKTGQPLWLPPYETDNLKAYVVSYNVPVYQNSHFIGVIGIEIGYETMGAQIKDIKVDKTGFAFIVDNKQGKIIYHPKIDLVKIPEDQRPDTPKEVPIAIASNNHHFEYKYEGVIKHAYWMELGNGMDIIVAVPLSEINATWISVVWQAVGVALVIIAVFIVVTILYSRHFTRPLRELTKAAEEIDRGNYKVKLDYKGKDEVGVLTNTVNTLIEHLGGYIEDLNSLAYADALTNVRNKSALNLLFQELQKRIDDPDDQPEFAIAMLDCDDLKGVNDSHGHNKGDVYLKNSCHLICRVFEHSPVYRIGGDEFVVFLQGEDYQNRDKLKKYYINKSAEISAFAKEPWEEIRVAVGIAAYDSNKDKSAEDVLNRADQLMYQNKRERKMKDN